MIFAAFSLPINIFCSFKNNNYFIWSNIKEDSQDKLFQEMSRNLIDSRDVP